MFPEHNNLITILELRRLLQELKDSRPDIGVRFRMMGEMWHKNHLQIFIISEKGVILNHRSQRDLVIISNLNNVMQFDIDHPFQQFRPHFHYHVNHIPET